jgi:hypothetical protein
MEGWKTGRMKEWNDGKRWCELRVTLADARKAHPPTSCFARLRSLVALGSDQVKSLNS